MRLQQWDSSGWLALDASNSWAAPDLLAPPGAAQIRASWALTVLLRKDLFICRGEEGLEGRRLSVEANAGQAVRGQGQLVVGGCIREQCRAQAAAAPPSQRQRAGQGRLLPAQECHQPAEIPSPHHAPWRAAGEGGIYASPHLPDTPIGNVLSSSTSLWL